MAKEKKTNYVVVKGVQWTPEMVKEKILSDDRALKNALLRIYSFQTEDEKVHEQTSHTNGKGFNGLDAEILTSFAKQLESKGWLSPKQIILTRKKMVKYSRQIFDYIKENRVQTYTKFGL
jgi:hypothetical protein